MKVTVEAAFDTADAPGGISTIAESLRKDSDVSDVRAWFDGRNAEYAGWNAVFTLTQDGDESTITVRAITLIRLAAEAAGAGPRCRIVELSLGYGVD